MADSRPSIRRHALQELLYRELNGASTNKRERLPVMGTSCKSYVAETTSQPTRFEVKMARTNMTIAETMRIMMAVGVVVCVEGGPPPNYTPLRVKPFPLDGDDK